MGVTYLLPPSRGPQDLTLPRDMDLVLLRCVLDDTSMGMSEVNVHTHNFAADTSCEAHMFQCYITQYSNRVVVAKYEPVRHVSKFHLREPDTSRLV